MIDLYYWPTPNGHKITMFLDEAGADYTIHPVDISAGDQFKPDFLAISPNNRMPAIIDTAPADGSASSRIWTTSRTCGAGSTWCARAPPDAAGLGGRRTVLEPPHSHRGRQEDPVRPDRQ
jgi:GST-like protein